MIYKPPSAERKLLDKNFKYTSTINAEAILHKVAQSFGRAVTFLKLEEAQNGLHPTKKEKS